MYSYLYGWAFLLWPVFFVAFLWALSSRWPNRFYNSRYNYTRHSFPNDGDHPHYSAPWSEGPHRGRGPKHYRRADLKITEDINDRFLMSGDLDATDIHVFVEDGNVTLSGKVHTRHEKRIAEWLAEGVAGVTEIKNELRMKRGTNQEESPHAA